MSEIREIEPGETKLAGRAMLALRRAPAHRLCMRSHLAITSHHFSVGV